MPRPTRWSRWSGCCGRSDRRKISQAKQLNGRLQQIEGDADKLILDRLRDLYSGRHEVTRVLVLRDLYELLEKIVDRCRDTGNVVTHIVLKHS